jgi:oxalate decarboxylase
MALSDSIYGHVASLSEQLPTYRDDSGCYASLNSTHLRLPERVSVRRVVIFAHCIGSTYSNQAAEQIGYCVGGRARIGVLSSQGASDTFTIAEGEALFLPSQTTHVIENIGDRAAEFIFALAEEIRPTQMTSPRGRSLLPGHDVPSAAMLSETLSLRRPLENGTEMSRFGLKRVLIPENDSQKPPIELSPEWPFLSQLVVSMKSIRAHGTSHSHQVGKRHADYVLRGGGDLRVISDDGEVSYASIQQGDVFSILGDSTYILRNSGDTPLEVISFRPRPKSQMDLAASLAETFLRPGELMPRRSPAHQRAVLM